MSLLDEGIPILNKKLQILPKTLLDVNIDNFIIDFDLSNLKFSKTLYKNKTDK